MGIFRHMIDEEMGEGFYEDAGDVEDEADDRKKINKADKLVKEATAEDTDRQDGECDAEVFAKEGL